MKLKTRLLLLLAIMLIAGLGGVFVLRLIHAEEEKLAAISTRLEKESLLDQTLPLIEYPLNLFANDYSLWDEIVSFVKQPTQEWARINIDAALTTFRLTAAWVLDAEGRIIYGAKEASVELMPDYPDPSGALFAKLKKNHFATGYIRQKDRLYALRAAPIQPSADIQRTSEPLGWLIGLDVLDARYLQRLATLNSTSVALLNELPTDDSRSRVQELALLRELRDPTGQIVGVLQVDLKPSSLTQDSNLEELVLQVALTLILMNTVFFCLHFWVLRPFEYISDSLVTGDPDVLKPLLSNHTEIGHIARLVRIHFAHQKALSRTIEDRAQLARDLHDGVIQSIYAAGMGVAAAQALLKADPPAAAAQLEQIRTSLNETIREARGFISGLESRIADDKPFGLAVETLLESMSWIRQVQASAEIDERAAQELTQQVRAHALQMVREAVSNSLRHSKARGLKISLQRHGDRIVLLVADDGAGFDTSVKKKGGRGLVNLVERARAVGASTTIESTPGKGTSVRVEFPSLKTGAA